MYTLLPTITLLVALAAGAPVPKAKPQFPGFPGGGTGGGGGFPGFPGGGTGGGGSFPGFPGGGTGGGGGFPGLPGGGTGGGGGGFPGFPGGGTGGGGGGFPGFPGGGGAGGSSTQNGITGAGATCKDVTLIFARGTSETGNMGSVIGPPLASALAQQVGADALAVQGVDYAADVAGAIAGGDRAGSQTMANLVKQVVQKCPDTKVVLSGYSQGAQLVHNADGLLDSTTGSKIAAAVTFGDPDSRQALKNVNSSNFKIFCAQGDAVCQGTFTITPAHLSYGNNAGEAAQFIAQRV